MKKIIDISQHQGNISLSETKASGIHDVILRVGWIGNKQNHTIDKKFINYITQAIQNNMNIGIYVYSYCNSLNTLKDGMEWVYRQIKEYKQHINLPVFLDLEDETLENISKDELTNQAKVFCEYFVNKEFKAGVYANQYWWTSKLKSSELLQYKIWVAQYNNKIERPTVDFRVDLWQYTSSGKVAGINGNVDMNYCLECDENVNQENITGEKENVKGDFEMKRYVNGSTKELVYKDTNCTQNIGYLFPREECECYGIIDNVALIVYKVSGSNNKKTGFVKWLGGVK